MIERIIMKTPRSVNKASKSLRTQARNLVMMFLVSKRSRDTNGSTRSFVVNEKLMRKVNATVPRGRCYKRMVGAGLIKNKWGYYD